MKDPTPQQFRTRAMGLAVISSLVSKGGNSLLMLVSIPLAFKVLGEERFGVYGVVQTLMWFITMSDLGMGPGVTRRIAGAVARGDREEETAAVSCAFFITSGFALLAAAAWGSLMLMVPVTTLFGAGFAPVAAELTRNLYLSGLLFFIMLVVNMLERCREGYQEIHIGNSFGAAQNVISATLLFFGIYHFPSVTFLLLAIYGVQCVTMSANAAWLVWRRPWLLPRWSRMEGNLARVMIGEGLALFVAGSVAPILQREGTKWLLGQMEGPGPVGRFTILMQLGFFLFGFVYMLSRPLWPAVADAVARGDLDWVRSARRRMQRFFFPLAAATVAGFTFLGPWAADWWLQKEVHLPRLDVGVFSLSLVLMVWSHLHYVMLAGSGEMRAPAVIMAVETGCVLLFSWVGIHYHGLAGALAGTSAGTLLFSAWMLPRRLSARLDAKTVFPAGTPGSAVGLPDDKVAPVSPETPTPHTPLA